VGGGGGGGTNKMESSEKAGPYVLSTFK